MATSAPPTAKDNHGRAASGRDLRAHRTRCEGLSGQGLRCHLADGTLRGLAPVEVDRRDIGGDDQHIGQQFLCAGLVCRFGSQLSRGCARV